MAVPNAKFTIAAAFGNVHGVYAPGNVRLDPEILGNSQKYIAEQEGLPANAKPVSFVFHGGSGSDIRDIKQARAPTPPRPPRCQASAFALTSPHAICT